MPRPKKQKPQQAPKSPFFRPSTPRSVVQVTRIQQSPGGSKHKVISTVPKPQTQEAKSTLLSCGANLTNAIVGSGIVGIPFAVSQAGLVAGFLLIILCAVLTEKSLRLLVATAKHAHTASYETVAEAAFGKAGFQFVAINMFIMAYGAMLSYMMIVKDVFPTLLQIPRDDFYRRRAILWIVSAAVMLPLSCQRDMANLSFTSRISVLLDVCLVALVAYNAPVTESLHENFHFQEQESSWQEIVSDNMIKPETIFVGLGVLSFAFVCQHSAFLIAGSLHKPTVNRWSTVTGMSLTFSGFLALASGAFGYLGYADETAGNILRNLPENASSNIARAMLGTTMLFVYPMESFVARHVCVALLFTGRRAHEGNDDSDLLQRWDRRVGLTMALYILALLPATLFDDLGPVLALTGAIGGSSLCYLGPGGVYLGIHGERFLEALDESRWLGRWHRRQSWSAAAAKQAKKATEMIQPRETTPLVAGNIPTPIITTHQDTGDNDSDDEPVTCCTQTILLLQTILAYILLMPVWCRLAALGRQGVSQHMHDLALKSPLPLRIGNVEYKRMMVDEEIVDAADDDDGPALVLSSSLPGTPNLSTRSLRGAGTGDPLLSLSINQQIGKQLVLKQKKKKRNILHDKNTITEPDPQQDPPMWYDFAIAMAYCLLGVVALVAGLASLAVSEAE